MYQTKENQAVVIIGSILMAALVLTVLFVNFMPAIVDAGHMVEWFFMADRATWGDPA